MKIFAASYRLVVTFSLAVPVVFAGTVTSPAPSFDNDPFPDKAIAVVENLVSPWSFSLEPYGWLPSLAGDVGIGGLPTSHVDYSAKDLLKNLKWGAFLKGEARYGRWGLLGDGFFVDIEADAELGGNLYRSAQVGVQQGLAQLALAYRVFEDRRGFVDLYVGARYNYLGLSVSAQQDPGGIQRVGEVTSEKISERLAAATDELVSHDAGALATQVKATAAEARAAAATRLDEVQRQIQAAVRRGERVDIERLQTLQAQLTDQLTDTIDADVTRFESVQQAVRATIRRDADVDVVKRWAEIPEEVRRLTERRALDRVYEPVRREFADLVDARVRQQVAAIRTDARRGLADEVVSLSRQRVEAAERLLDRTIKQAGRQERQAARRLVDTSRDRLAAAESKRTDIERSVDANTDKLEEDVAKAEKKLAKAISKKLEDELPTDVSGDRWWVDPIVGVRAQLNLTHWLYLATQCDVGGFGAGSDLAWNLNGTLGVNWSRSFFTELGYRYYYVDYQDSGVIYQVAESGIFLGAGIKF